MPAKYSRRHYQSIADVLKDLRHTPDLFIVVDVQAITDRFVTLFERDNPAFDAARFRSAVQQ